MNSTLPKVLHGVAGRVMVAYSVRAALAAGAGEVVVVVSPAHERAIEQALLDDLGERCFQIAVQREARGTGDAAAAGLALVNAERTLILCADTPLLRSEPLVELLAGLEATPEARVAVLSCRLEDPTGYGRILRDQGGRIERIREQRDLVDPSEAAVDEVNSGVYAATTSALREALTGLTPENAQGEYYLTDVVAIEARRGGALAVVGDAEALAGINDREQLRDAEARLLERNLREHCKAGVTIHGQPTIESTVIIEPDAAIHDGVALRGATRVGASAIIDVGCVITDAVVGAGAMLKPYSVVVESVVGAGAQIGPFAHLRPGSDIGEQAHIGNFVETKKTRVARGAKANHLAYLGDGDVGEGANVGAGTIFCNYDGYQKHRTVIGEGAFIGSDSQLVAPVTVGKGAYVATGTTVTKDVPAAALAIARVGQTNKENYAPRLREKMATAAGKKP